MIDVLLITNKGDITTDFVIKQLTNSKAKFYRLNTEDILTKVSLSFNFHKNEFILSDNERHIKIDLLKIKSVYYRRPKLPNIDHNDLTNGEKKFILNEISNYLEGLYKILKNAFWISSVFSIREAESKIHQLQVAKEIGLNIAPSLITNEKDFAIEFVNKFECIIKPIKTGFIEDQGNEKIIFTTLFTNKKELERVKHCPTYFQKFVNKTTDIRVTVIGNKVFSAQILSQEHAETKVDWRRAETIKLKYEKIELSETLINLCIKLTKRLNLNFGAIDFVRDEVGNFVFLEINPNGQWAWIEKQLNYNLSYEISKLLIDGKI
ncbi:MvdC/MvdD family ATP grasp protein [Flavobacterium oncorhynchi]|uniref:MvdC/MvdD family ATP grasp protein n=1 Tax=Flavobacterium oncorhynchi TaxID=728056 RepID=UPI00351AA30B